jgi:hypothetical protein
LGKKALSYQPNESDESKFILTRNKILPFVNNLQTLGKELIDLLNRADVSYNLVVDFNAVDNTVKFVEEKLCQN